MFSICVRTHIRLDNYMDKDQKGNIRIVDIAKLAGVSAGTVDRVLHKRGYVSEEKREKIEKVLKEINYEPNMVARFLASKKVYNLCAIIPKYTHGDYWEQVYDGINLAISELKNFNVSIKYQLFDQQDTKSFIDTTSDIMGKEYDGILIATLFGDKVIDLVKSLDEKEIPYVFIDSNIPGQNNLAYFGADSFISGSIAAKLMLKEIGNTADIIIAHIKNTDKGTSTQMQGREQGFMNYLNKNDFSGTLHHIEIDPADYIKAIRQIGEICQNSESLVGGIVFNSRIYELSLLCKKLNNPQVRIILLGYDSIEKNMNALKEDLVSFLIAQRPGLQGYDGIKALSNYLLFKQYPEKLNYMPLDILIKENIDYYNNFRL